MSKHDLRDITDYVEDLITLNSNLEGEATDSLIFSDIKNINKSNDTITIEFENNDKVTISIKLDFDKKESFVKIKNYPFKELNEEIEKLMEDYGETSILDWADSYEELGSRNDWSEDFLAQVDDEFIIATVYYSQAGLEDGCEKSNPFATREEALDYYNEMKEEE